MSRRDSKEGLPEDNRLLLGMLAMPEGRNGELARLAALMEVSGVK